VTRGLYQAGDLVFNCQMGRLVLRLQNRPLSVARESEETKRTRAEAERRRAWYVRA
jgi:hypothetical protein